MFDETASVAIHGSLNKYHYNDVIMSVMASQITSLTIVYSSVYSGAGQRKHQSSASLAFVRGIHRSPVNSPHKWPLTRKMFPFDGVIMTRTFSLLQMTCRRIGYQRPCYWLDGSSGTLFSTSNNFNHLFHLSKEKWSRKCNVYWS